MPTIKKENLKFLFKSSRLMKGAITGLAYSGFRRGQSPITKIYPSKNQILNDLKIIKES